MLHSKSTGTVLLIGALALGFAACTQKSSPSAANQPATPASAQNPINGKWQVSFDTQLGAQKYTFDLKAQGTTLTGTTVGQVADAAPRAPAPVEEGKIDGSAVTFVENFDYNGTPLRVVYTGTVKGDELQLHRAVGDIATEDATAKRVAP